MHFGYSMVDRNEQYEKCIHTVVHSTVKLWKLVLGGLSMPFEVWFYAVPSLETTMRSIAGSTLPAIFDMSLQFVQCAPEIQEKKLKGFNQLVKQRGPIPSSVLGSVFEQCYLRIDSFVVGEERRKNVPVEYVVPDDLGRLKNYFLYLHCTRKLC